MAAHRHQATYNGITFNRVYGGTDPDDPASLVPAYMDSDYRLDSLDMSRVSTTDLHELRQFMEGAEANEVFEGIRLLTGRGRILGASYADLEDKVWALNDAFSPSTVRRISTVDDVAAFPDEPIGVLPFDFKRDSAAGPLPLRFYGRPFIGRPLQVGEAKGGLARPYTFQLVVFDPKAYGQTLKQTALVSLNGGVNTVTNAGNAPTWPQIRVRMTSDGGATTVISNSTTGLEFRMDLSNAFGDYPNNLWLQPAKGEIVRESRVSKYALRKSGFLDGLWLAPGANTILWTPATGISSVRFDFRDAYS